MNDEKMEKLKQTSLKPQDVVVCLKFHLEIGIPKIQMLSKTLFISVGEVHGALKRAERSRLITAESGVQKIMQAAFVEFIVYGLKYAFPASTGPVLRGMPTGIAAVPEIERQFAPTEALPYVWQHPEGRVNGISLAPLFPSVPKAAAVDPELYKALALIDAIREGAARERELAINEIRMMLAI
jgi:hypothetical protein